ncbi:hypothetical protein ACWCO0_14975 [Streptomyces tubercidicus]
MSKEDSPAESGTSEIQPRKILTWRKQWLAFALIVAVAVPGFLYLSGIYDRWQDSRSLSHACKGVVDTTEVREILGADRIHGEPYAHFRDSITAPGRIDRCLVKNPEGDGRLIISLDWNSNSSGSLFAAGRMNSHHNTGMAIPIGHGWEGVIDRRRPDGPDIAILDMPCSNMRSSPKQAGLIVTLQAMSGDGKPITGDTQRARLARTATKTAVNAAKAWNCKASVGGSIDRVPKESAYQDVAAGHVSGTCKGIDSAVWESAADPDAPIEDCYQLATKAKGTAQTRLGAYYGPFAVAFPHVALFGSDIKLDQRAGGAPHSMYWATAQCPSSGTALYTVVSVSGDGSGVGPASPSARKAALKLFATQSAKRHGCTDLKFP